LTQQFDVHQATGQTRRGAPYLVVVQSRRLNRLPTRVVIPLIQRRGGNDFDPDLAPLCDVQGQSLILAPWQIFTIPITALGRVVASLAGDSQSIRIIRAIDEMITRAYG
jgi:mRNA-degrading endonuclease toxin of MazEF toxin-antitoxin module